MKIKSFLFLSILVFALGACEFQTYAILQDAGVDADGDVIEPDADSDIDSGPVCVPSGSDDTCNELDDDCDGVVDNDFDKQNDPLNCGSCGNICSSPNANVTCVEGECVVSGCVPGFADLDTEVAGCEYQCPLYPPVAEDCNGVDDDCDGEIDEPDELPAPPQSCRNTVGTPCEGVTMICDTRGTPPVTTWYCDYAAGVEFDPRIPNGIVLEETLCDGYDGDCDGEVDETFDDLGQECDNGQIGSCRDVGEKVCDPNDPLSTICDLSVLPDADPAAPYQEVCNGKDDNCDGIIDNSDPLDDERVIDDMIHITHHGLDFWIYTYEASRPDADSLNQGSSSVRGCSKSNALPWSNVNYQEASQACQAVGKRLCTAEEWVAACEGGTVTDYPYGDTYEPDTCNGVDYDTIPGGNNDDTLIPTGSLPMCLSDEGVFDLSGNLREWTNDQRGVTTEGDPVFVIRGGEYHTPWPGLTCSFDESQAASTVILPTVGFRCCSDTAP